MAYENILVETADTAVGIVTLNRPQVLNALSYDLVRELNDAVTRFEDDPAIRCVIITGAGDRAFSAGADIHEMAAATPEEMQRRRVDRASWTWHLANLKKPTIGALNGLAYGGAAVLSSSLDLRIGCERTKFRFLAAQYGRLNSTWSLPAVVGWPRAKELLYTARVVEAEEAAQIGLLNKVVPADQLMDAAIAMARQIATNTPEMVQGIKRLLHEDLGRSWREMYEAEITLMTTDLKPSPIEEGFADFLSRKGRRS
ncbi:MAG TPA: enoyl-CoA hydratase/isomerase family protein [Dehalococcoidia bacterium]|nr:enoyl-CoA hydratase/isomerase family protein [Dehalococcoidia bacterium]